MWQLFEKMLTQEIEAEVFLIIIYVLEDIWFSCKKNSGKFTPVLERDSGVSISCGIFKHQFPLQSYYES